MKRTIVLALLLLARPAAAQIPLDSVRVVGGSAEVLSFPVTADITELALRPGALHIRYSKQGVWPPVGFGDALQEATVWFFAHIDGQWVAAGMERLRPNQVDKPEGSDPRGFIAGFVEGRDFGPFNGHAFAEGEPIGVMVAAGISRLGSSFIARERSRVVMIPFPGANGSSAPPFMWVEGVVQPPIILPPPGPDPIQPPPPVLCPEPAVDLAAEFATLNAKLDALRAQLTKTSKDVTATGNRLVRILTLGMAGR